VDQSKILFCVIVKSKIVRSKNGKLVVGPFELIKSMLKLYGRGAKCVRYHGQEAYPVR
jgi:hypothetical protein